MTRMTNGWTRRRVLGAGAAGAAALAMGTSLSTPARAQSLSGKLTYWGGLIFSEDANNLLVETINAWGAANGVETEVVMINQNETTQKVSAAVSSNTMPDALDIGLDLLLLLSRQNQFLTIDDLYKKIGEAQGGWFDGAGTRDRHHRRSPAAAPAFPSASTATCCCAARTCSSPRASPRRPQTWEELVAQAVAVNAPPVSGLGLALSNVGDANVQVDVLQSYGGRIADDAGEKVTIKSEETRTYLTWLKDAWDKGIFPPGNTTWDGAGDNQAYLSGQAAFIANTGSVGIAAKNDDPELFEGSAFSPLPGGPKGIISPINVQLRAIPKASQNQDAAKALHRAPQQPRVHERLLQRRDLRPGAQGPGEAPGVRRHQHDPRRPARPRQGRARRRPIPDVYNAAYADLVVQLHHPQDGAARRRRRLGLRRGDGRSPGRRARRSTTSTDVSSSRRWHCPAGSTPTVSPPRRQGSIGLSASDAESMDPCLRRDDTGGCGRQRQSRSPRRRASR